ncbi:hypothetical protein [Acidithiobacillus ferrivorans]|uniref:hypothetical protein n=1 Tax=Acidithiobacillus ferrivorans TaxID=160808 RepID=UPI001C3FFB89|nr:hypothetical protein [Acidithiobacillus ferrivorans]
MDFTYERRGSVGVFSGFTICCQSRTEIGETFQGVLDVLEEQMGALFLCRENAPVSDGYRIVQGEKTPVYKECLDRIETGHDYRGKYYEVDASLGKKALELFHSVSDRQYGATDVRRNGAISKCLKWGLERC